MNILTTVKEATMISTQQVCPSAPGDAQVYVDQLTGYVLWGVISIFVIALVVSIGAIVLGRVLGMKHMMMGGVIGLGVLFIVAIVYLVFPGVVMGILGSGCINV